LALYFVVHTPRHHDDEAVLPPSRLLELAKASLDDARGVSWLKTWSPDLHDDRIFTLWEAASADQIRRALEEFNFLNDMDAVTFSVREWGPSDVLAEYA